MEMTYSSKTSVDFQWTAWCYIPEDRALQIVVFFKTQVFEGYLNYVVCCTRRYLCITE
jgi:hypothetical protein